MAAIAAVTNRRGFACGLGSLLVGLPSVGFAQTSLDKHSRRVYPWMPWKKIPTIVVVAAENDVRLPAIDQAVAFWNETLSRLGSRLRLGGIGHLPEVVPDKDIHPHLSNLSVQVPWPLLSDKFNLARTVHKAGGDIVVILSNGASSFASDKIVYGKVVIVIESLAHHPFTGQMDAKNVIAREFGHALGLGHNAGRNSLMCAPCYFGDGREGFLELTHEDELALLKMYPPDWQEELPAPQPWKGVPVVLPRIG
jgi:Matrixin